MKVLKIFGSSAQKSLLTKIFRTFILTVTLLPFCRYAFQKYFLTFYLVNLADFKDLNSEICQKLGTDKWYAAFP